MMDSYNVCKFNPSRSSDLLCLHFVYETSDKQAVTQAAANCYIGLVAQGEGVLECNGCAYDLSAGSLFFVESGAFFCVRSVVDLRYYYIAFYGRRADEYRMRWDIRDGNRVFEGHDRLISFWQESQQLAEEGNIDVVCEAVLLYSLACLKPGKKAPHDVISRTVALTQERFADPDLSITAVAGELGYDAKYLSSLFKKKKGVAFTEYLRELRIRHAVFLIEEGVVSVKNVALLSGFRDALYFSKVFTRAMGCSPKAYIKERAAPYM